MDLEKKKILVVAAHPDDEILGCGGTIIKAKKKGSAVSVLFLGEGVSIRFNEKEINLKKHLLAHNERCSEAKKVAKKLGLDNIYFENRFCAKFDELPLSNLVSSVEKIIKKTSPDIIFTHNSSETNIDHSLTYEAVNAAARPLGKKYPKEIYTFEVICSSNLSFIKTFHPNVYVDIEDEIEDKVNFFSLYKSELRKYPHPRSKQGLKILSRYRGLQSGLKYAEAFHLERSILI